MFKSFIKDTNGNMAVTFAVIMVALITVVGAAVDFTSINAKKNTYQSMADAAVLAAARSGENTKPKLTLVANDVIAANNSTGGAIISDIVLTTNKHIRVHVTGEHNMIFMGMFGKPKTSIQVLSEAPLASSQPVNIAMVLDVTGSMKGTKIAALRKSATGLVTHLQSQDSSAVKMSVVPFARYIKIPKSNSHEAWLNLPATTPSSKWHGCVGSRAYPYNDQAGYKNHSIPALMNVNCGQEILPLTANLNTVKTKISGLTDGGWTYLPSGLVWGWRTLSPEAPMTEASGAAVNTKNVMIVMSDGANTVSAVADGTHQIGGASAANKVSEQLCKNINNANVEVFSIAYDLKNKTAKSLLQNCASRANMFYDASNAADLDRAFKDIANRLAKLRLTH